MIVPDAQIIQHAISVLNDGGIVIYPTDTAFGIGCRIDRPKSIDRLFELRHRPTTQAMPVLVRSTDQALAYWENPSDIVRRLIRQHWPGALTIINRCKKELIYSPIRGGGDTVGLRYPKHTVLQRILDGVEVPIVGPSANFHGDSTPYRFEDVNSTLQQQVDFVVPGTCSIGQASTVVDCSVMPYHIVRQGAVMV